MRPKKNRRPGIAIYQFPYYKSDRGFLRIFLTKAFFACALSFSGGGLFSVLMEMRIHPVASALIAAIACLVTFVLLGFFRRLYVALFELALLVIHCFRAPVLQTGQDFLRQVFEVADGDLLSTSGIIASSEVDDPLPFFILLCIIFGAMCAFFSSRRFRPIAVLTFAEIMMIPAFLGQSLHFSGWLSVMIASMLGMWAATASSAVDVTLSSGWSSNLHMSDYVYLKANKKLPPAQKLRSEALHFGRHLSDSITVFIVVLLTVGITASAFPKNGSLRMEDIGQKVLDISQSIEYWFSDIFGSSGLNGYFSADGGDINISGNVNPDDLPTGDRPVAEIITYNTDKLYLRGDIGYAYKGEQWQSIAKLQYDSSVEKALENYAPEVQFYIMRYLLTRAFFQGADTIKQQTVKVNYLQNINTLLIGGTPSVFTPSASDFRENDNFSIYGDFVAVADKGKVNSMRLVLMYFNDAMKESMLPNIGYDSLFYGEGDVMLMWDLIPTSMSYEEYADYINTYRDFVYDTYTGVPEEETDNIRGFVNEVFANAGWSDSDSVTADGIMPRDIPDDSFYASTDKSYLTSFYASFIETYLTSGKYKYSLDTDNSAGDNTFLGNFLFDTRAGHCALYATAMCLALRYMGIPARYVTGFTVGGNGYTGSDEGNKYTVCEKDLHAWVEVYYDGLGWVPYDPTPGSGGPGGSITTTTTHTTTPATTPEDTTSGTTTTPRPTETTTTTPPTGTSATDTATVPSEESGGSGGQFDPETLRLILIIIGGAVTALAIVLSMAGALKSLRRREMERIRFFRTGEPVKAVSAMLPFVLKLLKMKGIHRRSGETPTEFAKRADGMIRIELEKAMPLFERAEFDSSPAFNEEEHRTVYECVSRLYGEVMDGMKEPKRLITKIKLFGKGKVK